jgi:hypothetical protein
MQELRLTQDNKAFSRIIRKIRPENFRLFSEFFLQSLTNDIAETWRKKVKESSAKEGWKQKYANSIQINQTSPYSTEIFTINKFSFFVEKGVESFDMKQKRGPKGGLLFSPQPKHPERVGKYRIVFMQKGTPEAQHINPMPNIVYTKVKKLPFGKSLVNTVNISSNKNSKMTSKQKKDLSKGYYEGLTKLRQKGQTVYGTFRIISKNSRGWIYPKISKVEIFPKIVEMLPQKIKQNEYNVIKKGLEQLSKEK